MPGRGLFCSQMSPVFTCHVLGEAHVSTDVEGDVQQRQSFGGGSVMVWTGMHHVRSGQLRSGQVRVFNVDIQSKLLQHTAVTAQGVKGGGGVACTAEEQASTSNSTGISSRRRVF